MKKNFNYICYVIIILVGLFDILYGLNYTISQYNFINSATKTTANIYQTTNRKDGKQVLYINYYVNDKKYDGVLVLTGEKTNKSTITIYYDKNNPLKLTSNEIDKSGVFIIILGLLFSLIGSIFLIQDYSKMKYSKNNKKM